MMRNTTTHLGGMAKGSVSNGISGEQPAHDRLGEPTEIQTSQAVKSPSPKTSQFPQGVEQRQNRCARPFDGSVHATPTMREAKAASSKGHLQRRQHRRARDWPLGSQGSVPPRFDPDDETPLSLVAPHFPLRRDRGEGEAKAFYPAQRREAEHAERRPSLTMGRTH